MAINKKEIANELYRDILDIWEAEALLETQKSKYIWLFKLMNNYEAEAVLGCAEWLKKITFPTSIAQLYNAMPRYLEWKKAEEKKKNWQYA